MHKMAYDAALMVGLSNDEVNSSPFELSGGQKRRAAMAGVLAMQPGILVGVLFLSLSPCYHD